MISYIQTDNISKRFGDRLLFNQITFNINQGDKVALVAKNGTGKTTLFNILAKIDTPTDGTISYKKDLNIGYLSQEPLLNPDHTLMDEMFFVESELNTAIKAYEHHIHSGDTEALTSAIEKMDSLKAWDYESKAKKILTILKLDDFDQKVSSLSGGQKKRLALAKVLLEEPEMLLLDEPTNHLDLEMIEWLEDFLVATNVTLFMVTHDRYFLDRVCNRILEIDDNELFNYNGNFTYYLEKRAERHANRQASIDKAQNLMRTEIEWVRRMPKARGTKAKYRMDAFEELKKKATENIQQQKVAINIQAGRLGNKIINIDGISKSYDDLNLFNGFSYKFARFEKVGIIGENGSGKTTLLNTITGVLKPDNGNIEIGETVKFGYYQQQGLNFDEETKVIDVVRAIAETVKLGDGSILTVSQFLNHFLFPPSTHHSFVYKLSGGEKRRLYLVTVLMKSPNFLILDEPTNDLDIHTLSVLEDYLLNFAGNVIVVTHDRYFMDKIVDHVFAFEGNGTVKDFPGNYSQYRGFKNTDNKVQTPKVQEQKKETHKGQEDRKKTAKLSYKENIELKELEKEIENLENDKLKLENKLSAGDLEPDALVETSEKLGQLMELLDEKTMRWMELSEKA